VLPQDHEHYFLLRRADPRHGAAPALRPTMRWADAALLPLCLLSPEMHNRSIVDRAFGVAGVKVQAAIETNSTVTLVMSVLAGRVCSVLPGALLGTARGWSELEALPLVDPVIEVPIAFLLHGSNRPSRTLEAAVAYAESAEWKAHAASHSGLQAL
jgi:DNA-binding transcriptional LysR family regulator